jgi:hypothetical protein
LIASTCKRTIGTPKRGLAATVLRRLVSEKIQQKRVPNEEERRDRQIERDQKSGALRSLIEKARDDFEAGRCTPL